MSTFDTFLWPIMLVVAWIMVTLHKLFATIGLGPSIAWSLSIVGLTICIRVVLIPLFFRQIKASRGLQLIQPEIRALQAKYKGKTDQASREAFAREQMELYKKHKTNPFSSCLPILAQTPVFFALFRVLYSLKPLACHLPDAECTPYKRDAIGPLTPELASEAEHATFFGAPLSDTFLQTSAMNTRIIAVVLILTMAGVQFFTQRQLTMKNMPPAALEGPMAQQQKMLMYLMPVVLGVTGVYFPVGILIYWATTNSWTLGQQFYAIRRMPAPGSEAEAALEARRARKARAHPVIVQDATEAAIDETPRASRQRQQPMGKARSKKQGQRRPGPGVDEPAYGTPSPTEPVAPGAVQDSPDAGFDLDSSGTLDEPARPGTSGPREPKKKSGTSVPPPPSPAPGPQVDAPESPPSTPTLTSPRKPRKPTSGGPSSPGRQTTSPTSDAGVAPAPASSSSTQPGKNTPGRADTTPAGSPSTPRNTPNKPRKPRKKR